MTGSNESYLPKIDRYLSSIDENSNFDENYLCFLSEDINKKIDIKYDKIKTTYVDIKSLSSLTEINCVQHGEFLKSSDIKDIKDNDIIFFTDGDIFLQRNLTDLEIDKFRQIKDNDIYVGYNASRNDTLLDEYNRLSPNGNDLDFINLDLSKYKVYNTGVLAMNKSTWVKVCSEYIDKFDDVNNKFGHYAKQQWLLSYIFIDYNVIEMDYDIHNHNIYGMVTGTTYENNYVFYEKNKCLFRHKHF